MSGRPRTQQGFLLIVAAVLIVIVGFLGVALSFLVTANVRSGSASYDAARALFMAESGLERGIREWSLNPAVYAGETGTAFGGGAFDVGVDDDGSAFGLGNPLANPNQKRIAGVGRVGAASRTVEAIVEGAPGGGIAYDARSSRGRRNRNNISWAHRVGAAGVNRILVVGVSLRSATVTVTRVTYAGADLQSVSATVPGVTNGGVRVELWYLVAPATGNNNIVVTLSGNVTAVVGGAVSFTGVDQTDPFDNFTGIVSPVFGVNYNQGTGTLATVQVTTASDNAWVVSAVALRQNANANVPIAWQRSRWNVRAGNNANNRVRGAGSITRAPVSPPQPVTMAWNFSSSKAWAMGAVALKPAPAGVNIIAWREVFP